MTPNAARLKTIIDGPANLPVLFVSDPKNGDQFIFGTQEELENELEAIQEENGHATLTGREAQLDGTHDLRTWVDFEAWEGDHPIIILN